MALGPFGGKTPNASLVLPNDFAGVFIAKYSDCTITYGTNNKVATVSVAKLNCGRLGKVISKSIIPTFETDKSEVINYNVSYSVSSKHSLDITMLQPVTLAEYNDLKKNEWCVFLASDILLDIGTPTATLSNLGGSVVTSFVFVRVQFTGAQKRENATNIETALKFEMVGKAAEESYVGEALTVTLT